MTDAHKLKLLELFDTARQLRDDLPLTIVEDLDSYESAHRRVSEARVALGRLDSHIFRIYGELYHMQYPSTIIYSPKSETSEPRPFTIDDL